MGNGKGGAARDSLLPIPFPRVPTAPLLPWVSALHCPKLKHYLQQQVGEHMGSPLLTLKAKAQELEFLTQNQVFILRT